MHRVSQSPVVPPPPIPQWTRRLPHGFRGPRPELRVVLKVLRGDVGVLSRLYRRSINGWDGLQNAASPVTSDPAKVKLAEDAMVQMMRYLADAWIDSGKSGGGDIRIDDPRRRNVTYAPPRNLTPKTLHLDPDPYRGSQKAGLNRFRFPACWSIGDWFYHYLGDAKRSPLIRKDGTQLWWEIDFGIPRQQPLPNATPLGVEAHWLRASLDFGRKVAVYWFSALLDSDFSLHLARCDGCHEYFAYDRAPRTMRKGGVWCPRCKGRSAAYRVEVERKERKERMLRSAADAWPKWERSRRNPDQREWVAGQVNRELGEDIHRKWVSQNLEEILRRAEGGNRARG